MLNIYPNSDIGKEMIGKIKMAREKMTPLEIREQMVSGIFGLIGSDSEITKEEIREKLNELYGVVQDR